MNTTMNKTYKTVYNAVSGTWAAVSELAKSQGKNTTRDLCKKALPSTAGTQTQVFGCFRLQSLLILPKCPLNPPPNAP